MPHNLRNQVSSLLQPESDFWNLSLTKPFILSLTGWRDSDSIRLCTCKYLVCNSSIFCVMNPGPSTFIYYAHLLAFMACLNFFMASLIFFFFFCHSLTDGCDLTSQRTHFQGWFVGFVGMAHFCKYCTRVTATLGHFLKSLCGWLWLCYKPMNHYCLYIYLQWLSLNLEVPCWKNNKY